MEKEYSITEKLEIMLKNVSKSVELIRSYDAWKDFSIFMSGMFLPIFTVGNYFMLIPKKQANTPRGIGFLLLSAIYAGTCIYLRFIDKTTNQW